MSDIAERASIIIVSILSILAGIVIIAEGDCKITYLQWLIGGVIIFFGLWFPYVMLVKE